MLCCYVCCCYISNFFGPLKNKLDLGFPRGVTRGVIQGVILRKIGEGKCVDTCVDTCVVQGGPGERSNLGKLGWHAGESKIFQFWACEEKAGFWIPQGGHQGGNPGGNPKKNW